MQIAPEPFRTPHPPKTSQGFVTPGAPTVGTGLHRVGGRVHDLPVAVAGRAGAPEVPEVELDYPVQVDNPVPLRVPDVVQEPGLQRASLLGGVAGREGNSSSWRKITTSCSGVTSSWQKSRRGIEYRPRHR